MKNVRRPAGFLLRLLAHLIDMSLLSAPHLLFFAIYISKIQNVVSATEVLAYYLVLICLPSALILEPLYRVYALSRFGKTLGKSAVGLEVEDSASHGHISLSQAFFREWLAKSISSALLGLGFLWIIKDKGKLAWHDLLAGTEVKVRGGKWLMGLIILAGILIIELIMIIVIFNQLFGLIS